MQQASQQPSMYYAGESDGMGAPQFGGAQSAQAGGEVVSQSQYRSGSGAYQATTTTTSYPAQTTTTSYQTTTVSGSPAAVGQPAYASYVPASPTGGAYSTQASVANYSSSGYGYGAAKQYDAANSGYDQSSYQVANQATTAGGSTSVSRYMSNVGYSASYGGRLASGATETSRVIGHEYGPERIVSVQQHAGAATHVVSERYEIRKIKVPKRIVHKEIIEKVVVIPEEIVREEIIEEEQDVREKIVEVARPIIEEKVIERPEIEIIEKIVHVPEIIYQEKIREDVQIQYQERITEVPKPVYQERVVEVPDVRYREVPVERVVEVPEIREEVILKQVTVPQYVDKPVPMVVEVEVVTNVERNIPVPVEAVIAYEFRIPKLKGHYTKVTYPVYLPRFIEMPIAAELYSATITSKAEQYLSQISSLTRTAASLCDIENLAKSIIQTDLVTQCNQVDLQGAVLQAWNSGLGASSANLTTTIVGGSSSMMGTSMVAGSTTMLGGSTMVSGPNMVESSQMIAASERR
eukprot:Protomagalhaensia_wolfi_Nauph_80__5889@NODE_763_length_2021_cov_61_418264_g573_i0_p1_GENE_NODE_763_length_2021_cov_61_418264_g573_i0NODE_763_length_2021_cov_61_418264_g573_i0_p1_ORF_typecomplete_len540_score137_72IMCp/PF12314_8/1_8e04IMCp/PF12314_8/3_2e08IMCp/PF12314_8/0_0064_NODE_763_length_2021_cov_61_418264_g573_i04011963